MASTLTWRDLELQDRLGEGQGGVVWSAHLTRAYKKWPSGTTVAVKRYKRWVLESPGQYERIHRELTVGMQVNHPNVVKSLALVADPEGLPALVMQHYSGATLDTFLREKRRSGKGLDAATAFRIIGEVASGLAAIHKAGLIHRDIKPSNIILSPEGAVVMDLGVVSSAEMAEQSSTVQFLGTIRYAAPEYLVGQSCTPAADVFSLGAIASELFTGNEFCSALQNWAALVADRIGPFYKSSVRIPGRVKRESIDTVEAMEFVLDALLEREHGARFKDLDALAAWTARKFWLRPFWVKNGRIVQGVPKYLEPFRIVDQVWRRPSKTVNSELRELLSESDLKVLASLFPDAYWSNVRFQPDQGALAIRWHQKKLMSVDCIDSEYPSKEWLEKNPCEYTYSFSETVRSLYRYGFLNDLIEGRGNAS